MSIAQKAVLGMAAAAVLVVALAVGGWEGGWRLNKASVNRSGKITLSN